MHEVIGFERFSLNLAQTCLLLMPWAKVLLNYRTKTIQTFVKKVVVVVEGRLLWDTPYTASVKHEFMPYRFKTEHHRL